MPFSYGLLMAWAPSSWLSSHPAWSCGQLQENWRWSAGCSGGAGAYDDGSHDGRGGGDGNGGTGASEHIDGGESESGNANVSGHDDPASFIPTRMSFDGDEFSAWLTAAKQHSSWRDSVMENTSWSGTADENIEKYNREVLPQLLPEWDGRFAKWNDEVRHFI